MIGILCTKQNGAPSYPCKLSDSIRYFSRQGTPTDLSRSNTRTYVMLWRDHIPFSARAYLAIAVNTLDAARMGDRIAIIARNEIQVRKRKGGGRRFF